MNYWGNVERIDLFVLLVGKQQKEMCWRKLEFISLSVFNWLVVVIHLRRCWQSLPSSAKLVWPERNKPRFCP